MGRGLSCVVRLKILKIHILFPFIQGPWGGGNQFLLALREKLVALGDYADTPDDSDVILFNSHHFGSMGALNKRVAALRRKGRPIAILHRVDGPIAVVRGNARDLPVDHSIAAFNHLLADGTIFQSQWSRNVCHSFGIGRGKPEAVIGNAPDSRWFHPEHVRQGTSDGNRIKIIATSWSANWRKGFDIYRFLDEALDHSRYEFTFVGNSPVRFQNIKSVPPLDSRQLGEALRNADIYLTASVDDPCSNAVVEALHCGLPVVARNSGGHPELVGQCGALFSGRNDVLAAIDHVATSLGVFPASTLPDMDRVAAAYLDFARQVHASLPKKRDQLPLTVLPQLWTGVARQRFWSSLTRKMTKVVPLRESRFHTISRGFRTASWESIPDSDWTEETARVWVEGVLARLPLFLDSMRHTKQSTLYRYSQSGDIQKTPTLAASVFAAKIMAMTNLGSADERQALAQHILSFQRGDGAITDPWVAANSRSGRIVEALRSRSMVNLFHAQTVRAETRQSMAALRSLGVTPAGPFTALPKDANAIGEYARKLDWTRPSSAASHISHLAFFMVQHAAWFGLGHKADAANLLAEIEQAYRRDDGAWYASGAIISNNQKINGAMKMVTALDAAGMPELKNSEGLIDICLALTNDGDVSNHFNVICVLHRCMAVSTHRQKEVHWYLLDRLRRYHDHYWPWQGGFSFFPGSANHNYCNARITTGMAEPDMHGTMQMLWGIVLICDVLGWSDEFGLKKPLT